MKRYYTRKLLRENCDSRNEVENETEQRESCPCTAVVRCRRSNQLVTMLALTGVRVDRLPTERTFNEIVQSSLRRKLASTKTLARDVNDITRGARREPNN